MFLCNDPNCGSVLEFVADVPVLGKVYRCKACRLEHWMRMNAGVPVASRSDLEARERAALRQIGMKPGW